MRCLLQRPDRGKQDLLLFHHVRFQFPTELPENELHVQQFAMVWPVCIDDLVDQLREKGKLLSQKGMVRLLDVIAQLRQRRVEPIATILILCRLGLLDLG